MIETALLLVALTGMGMIIIGMMSIYLDHPMTDGEVLNSSNMALMYLGIVGILFADLHITKGLLKDSVRNLQNIDSELYSGHLSLHHRICDLEKSVDNQTETGQKPN